MNSEHIKSEKLQYLINNYGVKDYIYLNNGKYRIKIFDNIIETQPYNLYNSIKKYENILYIIKIENETLLSTYIKDNTIWIKIKTYDGKIYDKSIANYNKLNKCRKFFKEQVKNNGHELLSPYVNATEKVYIDFKCGHKPHYISPNEYLSGSRCPICSNNIIVPHVNDCYTLRPDLLKYFINKEDSIGIAVHNRDKKEYQCPFCGTIKEDTLANIAEFGFSCSNCSDGIKYPNKFMCNILKQLGEVFDTEFIFDWCIFENYYKENKFSKGIYDIVIHNKKIIIEMDGYGHGDNTLSRTKEETIYVDNMKDKLAEENGYKVIRIDCKYKTLYNRKEYITNSILNSDLLKFYDFSNVDFDVADIECNASYVHKIWDLYNKGLNCAEISKIINLSITTISKYLKNGNKIGVCQYDDKIIKKYKTNKLLNAIALPCCVIDTYNNDILYFASQKLCRDKFYTDVSTYIKNNKLYKKRFLMKNITKDEFNHQKEINPDKAFGNKFIY